MAVWNNRSRPTIYTSYERCCHPGDSSQRDSHMYSDRIDLLDPCAYPQSMVLYNPGLPTCYPVTGGLPTNETLRNCAKCCTGHASPWWCHHQLVWYISVRDLRPLHAYTVFHITCRLQQRRIPGGWALHTALQGSHSQSCLTCSHKMGMLKLLRKKEEAELNHP
jgi:hypothetical protein